MRFVAAPAARLPFERETRLAGRLLGVAGPVVRPDGDGPGRPTDGAIAFSTAALAARGRFARRSLLPLRVK